MKNRFSTLSKSAKFMLVLLAAYGVTSSCKDEYTLDDEKPSWLNESIFESLTSQGTYNYYLRLIGDPDVNSDNARPLTEVLSRTGSNTVFAADDAAWEEFFRHNATLPETNAWHTATSYENLSRSQKLLLMNTSMLDHAVVMENLSSEQVTGDMIRGRIMRRGTRAHTTDSVTWLPSDQLPINYSEGNNETDLWARFRAENGGKGLYLVMDSVPSMMLHFTNEFLKNNKITDNDFYLFTGKTRNTEDVHIYDALLTEKDGVCQNGYVNKTEKVITPLPNMAEALRTDPETQIFSHMLDRWAAPFPNMGVTLAYRDIMRSRNLPWSDEDTIFSKRYFSESSFPNGGALVTRPDGKIFRDAQSDQVGIKFDPGWNGFRDGQNEPEADMAAMYVPNDKTLWEYFTEGGGGWNLIQTYYTKAGTEDQIPYVQPTTNEDLFRQIDQIPISTLKSFISNLMFKSFTGSVPSKMNSLRDDANEQLFVLGDENEPGDEAHIKRSILTNNGAIYITDKVYGPADFTSVAAPAFISLTNTIMRWAIYNGSTTGVTDYMGINYYAYLKAMQSRFAMFLPCNDGMKYYYDPTSFSITEAVSKTTGKITSSPRLIQMTYNKSKETGLPVENKAFAYNPKTGTIADELPTSWKLSENTAANKGELVNRLKDVLESHTLVLDGQLAKNEDYIESDADNFYLAKNGAPIKVTRNGNHIVKVQGGFQIENENAGITGEIGEGNKNAYTEIHGMQTNDVIDYSIKNNGITYILDSPMIPASRSVYTYIDNERELQDGETYYDEYAGFSSLCNLTTKSEEIIKACGLIDINDPETTVQKQNRELKKYYTFFDENGLDYNVVFFNNYNYTIFVPTNSAVQAAIDNGLPTWESIIDDYESLKDEETDVYELTLEDSLRLQAKIICLTNFIRYHFADNSVFVDNSNFDSKEYVTSSFDKKKGLFSKINVQRQGGQLMVKDANGGNWATVSGRYNVLARDIICSKKPDKKTMSGITIEGTSFAVIHQIPASLNHIAGGGRYDEQWKTPEAARRYIQRYAIPALNN